MESVGAVASDVAVAWDAPCQLEVGTSPDVVLGPEAKCCSQGLFLLVVDDQWDSWVHSD